MTFQTADCPRFCSSPPRLGWGSSLGSRHVHLNTFMASGKKTHHFNPNWSLKLSRRPLFFVVVVQIKSEIVCSPFFGKNLPRGPRNAHKASRSFLHLLPPGFRFLSFFRCCSKQPPLELEKAGPEVLERPEVPGPRGQQMEMEQTVQAAKMDDLLVTRGVMAVNCPGARPCLSLESHVAAQQA